MDYVFTRVIDARAPLWTAKDVFRSNWHLHRVLTTPKCEQSDCFDVAVWIVLYPKVAQFLCREHTVECMSDKSFWNLRGIRNISEQGRLTPGG